MRKATLLYNARSGGRRNQREADLQSALKILAEAGVEASLTRTQSNVDAGEQARKAILEGSDTVFACGGDGTIHDVLQAMVGTRAALGVIPLGTANALAHDMGLPMDPRRAVRAVMGGQRRTIAVGQVKLSGLDNQPVTRYFTVAVGVGVDAHLFYKLNASVKQRLGMRAYYAKAWQLWFSHRMEQFHAHWSDNGAGPAVRHGVTELLAVRIRNFGGVLRELAPGASLERDDLRLVACSTSNRLAYLGYVMRGLLGAQWSVPGVELAYSKAVKCDYPVRNAEHNAEIRRVYVEADGELVGTLPAEISILPDALTLLMPRK